MPEDFLTPDKLGMLGMMALAVLAFLKGWVVTSGHVTELKSQYESRIGELTKDREDYKSMLRDAVIVSRKTLDVHGVPTKRDI